MTGKQHTLTGEETDEPREKPDTFRYCLVCEEHVLRSRWGEHEDHEPEHERKAAVQRKKEKEANKAEKVGELWDIRLHYSVEYSFRVPAFDRQQAETLAKEWQYGADPVDSFHVHTDRHKLEDIFDDDNRLPDDWDPYGDERMWEAFDRNREESE